jgi:hypothetical protein
VLLFSRKFGAPDWLWVQEQPGVPVELDCFPASASGAAIAIPLASPSPKYPPYDSMASIVKGLESWETVHIGSAADQSKYADDVCDPLLVK